jgi:hypothetical protein
MIPQVFRDVTIYEFHIVCLKYFWGVSSDGNSNRHIIIRELQDCIFNIRLKPKLPYKSPVEYIGVFSLYGCLLKVWAHRQTRFRIKYTQNIDIILLYI